MLRGFAGGFTLVAALFTASVTTADPDVRLPPGTRQAPEGHYVAGRGLRDSSDFLAKELARRGLPVEQIGPYRVRGVEVTRFLSQSEGTSWLAIHVLRIAGKTLIFFVPRTKA